MHIPKEWRNVFNPLQWSMEDDDDKEENRRWEHTNTHYHSSNKAFTKDLQLEVKKKKEIFTL